jgi:hypothetical protein
MYHKSPDKLSVSNNFIHTDFPDKFNGLWPFQLAEKCCEGTSQARMDYLWINFKAGNNGKLPFVEFFMGYDKGMFMKDKITKKKYIEVDDTGAILSPISYSSYTVLDAHK